MNATRLCLAGLTAAALLAVCGGCYTAPFKPPQGVVFTQVKAPLMINQKHTPVATASGSVESSCIRIPNPWVPLSVAWDDCSVENAAKAGGITNVHYADYEFLSVLGIYNRMTVTAYGDRTGPVTP
ncbi:MAG: TRL domain-containing protein [Lentisphaeria bacterium]